MTKFPAILALICSLALFSYRAAAEDQTAPEPNSWVIQALSEIIPGSPEGRMNFDQTTGEVIWTNGVYVHNDKDTLTADNARVNPKTGMVWADGHVRIESGDMVWTGEHITYNFKTKQMTSEQYRTGRAPVFASGEELTGNGTNKTYFAQQSFVTTDDVFDPIYRLRASRIEIIPNKKVKLWNMVVMVGDVPVFYFPYYERNIGRHANNFNLLPGYRSAYGPYVLGTYVWYLGDSVDGKFHVDYRGLRGPGVGPDVNLNMGRWGNASLKYYYTYDQNPNKQTNGLPFFGDIPHNRQRFYLGWQATPATNLNVKALVNYQSDPLILHDFFEGDYTENPQPNTFVEVNKYWENWSVDALTTPRVNSFFSQIQREPEVQLTGYRQQVLGTPVYYDSQNSVGWYRSFMANMTNGFYPQTNGFYVDQATRADTFHQLSLPFTLFNWLNIDPNVGGRMTYYSAGNATNANTGDIYRGVFNTGIGTSFKLTALWTDSKNSLFEVDGLRHIIEPSVNYVFVPDPSTPPAQLPQFDAENPALLIAPVNFPDYNSIDSIDTQNVMRFGLRNVLQTKRDGQLQDLVNWNLMMDWRLDPKATQTSLNDLYSKLLFRPRTWLAFDSEFRYNIDSSQLNMAFHQVTFSPNDHWSWGIGHWYLRSGFIDPQGDSFITSSLFYRMNDNWGARMTDSYNVQTGRLQDQHYTIYRDMRSWTAALVFRVANNVNSPLDFTVAFSLSLKANPSMHVGDDVANKFRILGE